MSKGLTRKQSAFVKELVDNPKISATEAAARSYGSSGKVMGRHVAEVIAHENLRKPEIIMALGEHSQLFESAIVGTVKDWQHSDSPRQREIALDAAKFGHDKIHGKATTKIESMNTNLELRIDLFSDD